MIPRSSRRTAAHATSEGAVPGHEGQSGHEAGVELPQCSTVLKSTLELVRGHGPGKHQPAALQQQTYVWYYPAVAKKRSRLVWSIMIVSEPLETTLGQAQGNTARDGQCSSSVLLFCTSFIFVILL